MKIDEKTINTVLKMSDDRLWQTIQFALSRSGSDMLKGIKRPEDMSKIRNALSSLTNQDLERVTEILKETKSK